MNVKKRLLILFSGLFFGLGMYAQAPDAFQYQAVISDNGSALKEANVKVRFNIRENSATGTAIYTEEHEAKTNVSGMVFLQIGKGAPAVGNFSTIAWIKGNLFIETEIDKNNGAGFVSTGVQQFLSVPYAKYADTAGKLELISSGGKKFSVIIDDNGNISTQEITE